MSQASSQQPTSKSANQHNGHSDAAEIGVVKFFREDQAYGIVIVAGVDTFFHLGQLCTPQRSADDRQSIVLDWVAERPAEVEILPGDRLLLFRAPDTEKPGKFRAKKWCLYAEFAELSATIETEYTYRVVRSDVVERIGHEPQYSTTEAFLGPVGDLDRWLHREPLIESRVRSGATVTILGAAYTFYRRRRKTDAWEECDLPAEFQGFDTD